MEEKDGNKVEIDEVLMQYLMKKIEEDKKREEKEEREKALLELRKYVPHLVDLPDKYAPKHILSVAKMLSEGTYKPREQRRDLKLDLKENKLFLLLLGAIIVVGVLGVVF